MTTQNNPPLSQEPTLEERHRISALVFKQIAEAVVVTSHSGRIMLANPAFAELVGESAENLRGQLLQRFLASHDAQFRPCLKPNWQLAEAEIWRGEVWLYRHDGTPAPVWLTFTGAPAPDGEPRPIVACFTDLSLQHQQQQQLWDMAHHDRITGLPNFHHFEEVTEKALGTDGNGQLVLLHINGISDIAGAHGHSIGEQVLRRLAARLLSLYDNGLTAYLDNGDFGILLPQASQEEALQRARTCLTSLQETVQIDELHFHLKPYAGLCGYPDSGRSVNELIRHARLAVDEARHTATPCLRVFDELQDEDLRDRLKIDAHLTNALAKNEFRLVYQPQIDLATGHCVGAEALLRWHSADLGNVPPNRFIPVAESSGAMLPIGAWVLDEACRQMRAWQDAGLLHVPVAVNVSAPQLLEEDLPEAVRQALERHKLDPHWLEIEITEGLLLTDSHRAGTALAKLAEMGVGLALDDFGTGYASFSYLQRFHFHRLKIDRSLVTHVSERPRDAAIVCAIIGMGRALDMEVLAEGIEMTEQARTLSMNGCHVAQGFLYARPLPAEEAGPWISNHVSKQVA